MGLKALQTCRVSSGASTRCRMPIRRSADHAGRSAFALAVGVVLPAILGDTVFAYRIFSGKVRPLGDA